jgi:hypothetical protein
MDMYKLSAAYKEITHSYASRIDRYIYIDYFFDDSDISRLFPEARFTIQIYKREGKKMFSIYFVMEAAGFKIESSKHSINYSRENVRTAIKDAIFAINVAYIEREE